MKAQDSKIGKRVIGRAGAYYPDREGTVTGYDKTAQYWKIAWDDSPDRSDWVTEIKERNPNSAIRPIGVYWA